MAMQKWTNFGMQIFTLVLNWIKVTFKQLKEFLRPQKYYDNIKIINSNSVTEV